MATGITEEARALKPAGLGGFVLMLPIFFGTMAMAQTAVSQHGPTIMMVMPAGNEALSSPCDIRVRFDHQGYASVDLSTLQVTVLKLWEIDITDRVRPYASVDGITMTEVDLPTGQHTLKIAIADDEGHMTAKTMSVNIQ